MKYPATRFTRSGQKENGASVIEIWRSIGPRNESVKGYIAKNLRGMWQVDIATRYYGQRIMECATLSDAKQAARELLA